MFAIIEESGHQIRVSEGDVVTLDLKAGVEVGQTLTLDRVLLANAGGASILGAPVIESATVEATVIEPIKKGVKLEIGKLRRRKNSRRHTGHRQKYTTVKIGSISVPGLEVVTAPAAE
ncbi:MAG: 50S ribosomal protein L21 [Planctomycetaceae bacterium]